MKNTTYKHVCTLKSLPIGKAAGPVLINNQLLKELVQPLALPLSDLFNLSLSYGSVPHIWKEASVSPIHKKNDPSDVFNYGAHKYLFNFFEIITPLQLFNRFLSQLILLLIS